MVDHLPCMHKALCSIPSTNPSHRKPRKNSIVTGFKPHVRFKSKHETQKISGIWRQGWVSR